jgi:cytochrome c oxidase subunit 2
MTAALATGAALAQSSGVRETFPDHGFWMPADYSTTGGSIDLLFNVILGLTMFTLLAVTLVMVVFLVRYRHKPGRTAKFIHGNNKLELTWTLVPTIILAMIAVFSQTVWAKIKYPQTMPAGPETVAIDIIGQQFQWNFHYPGADGEFGSRRRELVNPNGNPEEQIGLDRDGAGKDDFVTQGFQVIPVDRPVVSHITSRDVIHSYFLPNFRIKQDAVPGLNPKLWVQATATSAQGMGVGGAEDFSDIMRRMGQNIEFFGDADKHADVIKRLKAVPEGSGKPFEIVCAELCGQGHFKMRGRLYVVDRDMYELFLAGKAAELPSDEAGEAGEEDYGY